MKLHNWFKILVNFYMFFGVGEAIGIGASVIGGAMSKNSADKAGKQIGKANALTQQQIEDAKQENNRAYDPYRTTGADANAKLADYLGLRSSNTSPFNLEGYKYQRGGDTGWQANINGKWTDLNPATTNFNDLENYSPKSDTYGSLLQNFSPTDLANDTVYNTGLQFGLDEGTKGINRLASSNGGIDSGATLKALTRYANDYGTTKAGGAYDRFNQNKNNIYNMLSGQQGVGLNATNNNQTLNNGLLTTGINSNQQAASDQANANMYGNQSMINGINGGIGNYLYSQRMQQTAPTTGTYGGSNPNGTMSYNSSANNSYNRPFYA